MISKSPRHQLFWSLDGLKNNRIKRQLEEIELGIKQPNSEKALQIKNRYLSSLIAHAVKTTPYYAALSDTTSISDFPVIGKTTIQDNFEDFKSSEFKDKPNFKVSTSGSTGVPFFLFQNLDKRHRNRADVIYFFREANFTIGNRLYELEVWRGHNKKGRFKSWLQNVTQFDISRLTDERIETFLGLLKSDKRPKKALLGFASAYEMIAQYLEKNNIYLKELGIMSAKVGS